jgi:hypothetical protein
MSCISPVPYLSPHMLSSEANDRSLVRSLFAFEKQMRMQMERSWI